jgi:hypothetical protein
MLHQNDNKTKSSLFPHSPHHSESWIASCTPKKKKETVNKATHLEPTWQG